MKEKVRVIEYWRKPTSLDKADQKTIWKYQYGEKEDNRYAAVSYFIQVSTHAQRPNWQPVGHLLESTYEDKIQSDTAFVDVLCRAYPHIVPFPSQEPRHTNVAGDSQ